MIKDIYGEESVSVSAISRVLSNNQYCDFISIDKNGKIIYIKNNIKDCKQFVVLSKREVMLLIKLKKKMLIQYYLYHKFYCGRSSNGCNDSTAKQILDTIGLSSSSNANISMISEYNQILVNADLI